MLSSGFHIGGAEVIDSIARGERPEIAERLRELAWSGELPIITGKPPRYSATTIQWHTDCERKFYWPTVAGLEAPPSAAQEDGTELHKHAEVYQKEGVLPSQSTAMGRLLLTGLSMLPKPKSPGLHIEEPFEFVLNFKKADPVPNIIVTGTIDCWREPQLAVEQATSFDLQDQKTARTARYPKTREWLSNNIQSNLYAKVVADKLKAAGWYNLKTVKKQWNYFYKDEKRAAALRVVDSLEHVEEQYETVIKPNLVGMARIVRDRPRVGDIPAADKSVCEMYGGCPHYNRCWANGEGARTKMGALAGKFSKQALTEKVQTIKAAGAGAAINPPKPKAAPPINVAALTEDGESLGDQTVEGAEEQAQDAAVEEAQEQIRAKGKKTIAKAAKQLEEVLEKPTPKKGGSKRAPGYNSEHNYWLCINCMPEFGFTSEPVHLDKILGEAQANAAEAAGSPHYRYGNSYGVLESAFASYMEENALVGAILVDTDSIATRDVIGLLRAHAAAIWAGRR